MEEYIGKKVWLHIKHPTNDKDLFFNCIVDRLCSTHIHFTDKFECKYSFRRMDVISAKPLK